MNNHRNGRPIIIHVSCGELLGLNDIVLGVFNFTITSEIVANERIWLHFGLVGLGTTIVTHTPPHSRNSLMSD